MKDGGTDTKLDAPGMDGNMGMDGGVDTGIMPGMDCHMDAGWQAPNPPSCPTPRNVTGWVPGTLGASVGKHTGACTQQQLDLYHQCTVQGNMSACMSVQQQAMTTFKTCLTCLESTTMDPQWGPLVCVDQQTCYLDVENCVNLAASQSGCMSCGQYLYESYGCQRIACEEQCMGDSQGFSQCVQTALAGGCKMYGDTFNQKCGSLDTQTYPDLDNCFRRQNETDSSQLRVRMDTYMCGN